MLQILKQRTVFGEGSQLYADEFPVEVARSRETLKRSM